MKKSIGETIGTVIGYAVSVPLVIKSTVEGIYEGLTIDYGTKRLDGKVTYYGEVVEEV